MLYIAIHRCFGGTALGSIAPAVVPSDGSTARCPPSLHWVPSAQVPLLPRYYEDTTTSRRPSCLASFPSLGNTIHAFIACVLLLRSRQHLDASARGPGISCAGNPFRLLKAWRQRDLPGSWMTLCTSALFSDPGRADVSGHLAHRYCPRNRYDEGLGNCNLSRLNHRASVLASYASCTGRPNATQGWLLAAGQLYQVGLISHWVMPEGFEVLFRFIPLLQAWPGAKRYVMSIPVRDRSRTTAKRSLPI